MFFCCSGLLYSQKTYTVGSGSAADKSQTIVEEEIIRIGLERLSELVKIAESGDEELLNAQFAARNYTSNPNNTDDKANYAVVDKRDTDKDLSAERIEFFLELEKNCGEKQKIRVGYMNNENEPFGHAFRLTIPAVLVEGNYGCDHYTVSFRADIDNKLLITEWYSMPGNTDCQ